MSTADTERYVRITLLTFEGGLWISRKILIREVNRSGSSTLDALLLCKKSLLKSRRDITKRQYETLFPKNGNDTDIAEWDLSLLIRVIKVLFCGVLSGQDIYSLEELLRIRNEVVCHARESSVSEQDFYAHWTQLTMCIGSLASHFDVTTTQYASELTQRLSRGPLDLQSSIEQLAKLCRNDEHMERVLERLAKQERMLNEVASGVTLANKKLDEVLAVVRDLKLNQNAKEEDICRVVIPMLNTTVCISGKKDHVVKLAEEILLKVHKTAVDKVENPQDEDTVKEAVQQFLADIESKGAVVVSAESGSILLKIRCNDLDGLDNMLRLFKINDNRYRLVDIENALNAVLLDVVRVELVLPDNTIEMLRDWIGKYEQVHKRYINLGFKCESAEAAVDVMKYLQSGQSADRLNQIAEVVSKMVGAKIQIEATSDVQGFLGHLGQDHLRNQTEQACASNDESDIDRIVYSDYTGPLQTPSKSSAESPTHEPNQLSHEPVHTPPERPPKPTTASKPANAASNQKAVAATETLHQRKQLYKTPEGYISNDSILPDDDHHYDSIHCDIRIGKAGDKLLITHMHVLPNGYIVLYDKVMQQLMVYDAKMMKCQSSHQMQSAVIGMCTIRLGTEDRVYVVVQGNISHYTLHSSELIHFVIDTATSQLQTKGSATLDYESSGLTGYDSGIAVIQNKRKGRMLLHLYNKNYREEKVLSFDFRISLTDKLGSRHGPEQRFSLSTVGRGKLAVIADCKYNFVAIVDVERGQQVLKYENASLTCPSQVATYQDNIVFILCRETGNIHVMEITGSADQRRELTSRDTKNLKEWSPEAMCCCASEGKLYVSHSQFARVRPFKLGDLKLP